MSDDAPPVRLQHLAWKYCQVVERLLTPARPTCVSSMSLMSARTSVAAAVKRPLTSAAARITPSATALMTVFVFHRDFFRSTHDTVRFSLPLLGTAPEAASKGMLHYSITSSHNSRYVRCSYRIQRIGMVCRARSLFAANTRRSSPRSKVQSLQAAR